MDVLLIYAAAIQRLCTEASLVTTEIEAAALGRHCSRMANFTKCQRYGSSSLLTANKTRSPAGWLAGKDGMLIQIKPTYQHNRHGSFW
ncbi:hypothetical protein sync_1075 [Synechococcus sp. CC9311]|nr:hypothetical protein sync_1075 [Synechococcus sp. CC9311]